MPKPWKKLKRRMTESRWLSRLFDKADPAESLYWRMVAASDEYGRLPGLIPWFRGKVCPRSEVNDKKLAARLQMLVSLGKVRSYEVEGEQFLEIVNYTEEQETDWSKTAPPDYPTPPNWQLPSSLAEFLTKHPDRATYPLGRFGLETQGNLGQAESYPEPTPQAPLNSAEGVAEPTPQHTLNSVEGVAEPTPPSRGEREREREGDLEGERERDRKAPPAPPPGSLSLSALIAQNFGRDPKDRRALETSLKKWPAEAQQAAADDLQRHLDAGDDIHNPAAYLNRLLPIKAHLERGGGNGTEFEVACALAELWKGNGSDRDRVANYLDLDFPRQSELRDRVLAEVFGA